VPGIARDGFKRSLFGYRPSEVHGALELRDRALEESRAELERHAEKLEARRRRIEQLEMVCDRLCDRVVERGHELAEARAELDRLRGETQRGLDALARLTEQIEGVRSQARGQATRIRLRALRDAAELAERAAEVAERPGPGRERLLDSLHAAIERMSTADTDRANEAAALEPGDEIFDGRVEVEVGPFDDFSQLVGFEDAAGQIGATSEISVKRFARGRATLEVRLTEPVELLRELEERSPFEFRVRDRRFDRLVLDVDAE
jgi:cell division septum initiation protein DivIVA